MADQLDQACAVMCETKVANIKQAIIMNKVEYARELKMPVRAKNTRSLARMEAPMEDGSGNQAEVSLFAWEHTQLRAISLTQVIEVRKTSRAL